MIQENCFQAYLQQWAEHPGKRFDGLPAAGPGTVVYTFRKSQ
jgi:hypothetical protein